MGGNFPALEHRPPPTLSPPPMPLLAIACPRCLHTGFIAADRLPGMLCCSSCGFVRMVRDGGRLVHSTITDQLNGNDAGKAKQRVQKRILTPRVA